MNRPSRFSLHARRRNPKGGELELDIQAFGVPAIAVVAVLAAGLLVLCLLRWLS
jgi:hypothetical protein